MLKKFFFNKRDVQESLRPYEDAREEAVLTDSTNHNGASSIFHRLGEVIFICVFSLSLFILLSLLSYNKMDPNWFGLASFQTTVSNSGGWVGAYLADVLLFLMGWSAYAVPFVMVYVTWFQLYPERYHGTEKEMPSHRWQLMGVLLFFLGATGLSDLFSLVHVQFFPYTAGGLVGEILSKMLVASIQSIGALLLLLALFLMGITLFTGLSWINLVEKIGFFTVWLFNKVISIISQKFNAFYRIIFAKKFAEVNVHSYGSMNEPLEKERPIERDNERMPRINGKAASILSASVEQMPVSVGSTFEIPSEKEFKKRVMSPVDVAPSTVKAKSAPFLPKEEYRAPEYKTSASNLSGNTLPPLSLLEPAQKTLDKGYSSAQLETMAREVEQRLLDFGIEVQVVAVHPGPVITRFELQLAAGVKVSRISGLAKDLARSLSVTSVRVVDVIPGKPVIGLELPNQYREMVRLSEVFLTDQFQQARSPVSIALGVDISGYPVVVDLAKMPHLLVAGTTGSGKSVGLNAMLLSILFKATPEMVRLILVDPKMLEFSIYDRIPHLLTPVVTDMKEAAGALRWSVAEMERRYRLMSALGVRNLAAYNTMIKEAEQTGQLIPDPLWKPTQDMQASAPFLEALPYIVVVIDELADMMMVVGKKVEQLIARIAQKARAAGIHLILATQRPSVDVLTGLIKSNIPTRIAFQVSSKIDSRTILDQQGAEQLLGHGDMLYLTPGSGSPVRIHGAFVDDKEVHRVVEAWRELAQPEYVDIIGKNGFEGGADGDPWGEGNGENVEDSDPLYDEAVQFITETRKASISSLQRRMKIGYNRAARLIEEMERTGIVGPMESSGTRDVLIPRPEEG